MPTSDDDWLALQAAAAQSPFKTFQRPDSPFEAADPGPDEILTTRDIKAVADQPKNPLKSAFQWLRGKMPFVDQPAGKDALPVSFAKHAWNTAVGVPDSILHAGEHYAGFQEKGWKDDPVATLVPPQALAAFVPGLRGAIARGEANPFSTWDHVRAKLESRPAFSWGRQEGGWTKGALPEPGFPAEPPVWPGEGFLPDSGPAPKHQQNPFSETAERIRGRLASIGQDTWPKPPEFADSTPVGPTGNMRRLPGEPPNDRAIGEVKLMSDDGKKGAPFASNSAEWPTQAAVRVGEKVFTGNSHFDAVTKVQEALGENAMAGANVAADGFLTNQGRYVSREEAGRMLDDRNQTRHYRTWLGNDKQGKAGLLSEALELYDPKTGKDILSKTDDPKAAAPFAMDEASRLQRARDMGYDVDNRYYHGTASDFDAFDKAKFGSATDAASARQAAWMVSDPRVAGGYARYAAEDAPVRQLMQKADTYERLAQKTGSESWWDKQNDAVAQAEALEKKIRDEGAPGQRILPLYARGKYAEHDMGGAEFTDVAKDISAKLREAKQQGLDGVKFHSLADDVALNGRPATHVAVFDPKNIRSVNAQFDPAKADSANLLASRADEVKGAPFAQSQEGPIRAYHGSTGEGGFEKFKRKLNDVGVHFGTAEQANDRLSYITSRERSGRSMEGAHIIPVDLDIKRPLRLPDLGAWDADNLYWGLEKAAKEGAFNGRYGGPDAAVEALKKATYATRSPSGQVKALQEFIRRQGYDGIVYKNDGEVAGAQPYQAAQDAAWQNLKEASKRGELPINGFSQKDQQHPAYRAWSDAMDASRKYRTENAQDSYIAIKKGTVRNALTGKTMFSRSGGLPLPSDDHD